ncbi:hypothetical protein DPMN_055365 [Dreissena polymorpha]|uniref:Uncharacterized protein n=1 Tax=Dreissena polymorpha TaxID=45954 RepID=A0A9D4CRP7_DREPO|nr:hypothetical protein DPMN_055365 [Dreissena polymorpha]
MALAKVSLFMDLMTLLVVRALPRHCRTFLVMVRVVWEACLGTRYIAVGGWSLK